MPSGNGGFEVPAGTIVMNTAVDLQQIDRDLKEIDKKGEKAGKRAGQRFGSGFSEGADTAGTGADKVKAKLDQAGKKAEEAAEKMESTDEKVDELGETMETTAKGATALAITLAQKVATGISKVGATAAGIVAGGLDLMSGAIGNLGRQLQEQSDEFGRFAVAAEGAGRALEFVARVAAAVSQAVTGARVAIVAGAGALAIASKRAMDDFVPSWNRVLTLIPDNVEGLTELRREVDRLGSELGLTAEVTNDTFYKVLSAMPQVADEPRKALDVLRVALEAGATGFTEAATAAKAITGVLNAFQMEASEARRVSDALFAAQDQGVLTFGQIASEISKVSGITNALGGSFEDLLAIVATTTGELSQSVPETFTQIRGVIRAIVSPTSKAQEAWMSLARSSEELSAAMIRKRGLIGAIERVVEVTEGNPDAISEIIPRANAQTLVISLADRMDRLRGRLEEVGNASGKTREKVDQMLDSWEDQGEVFDAQIDRMLRLIAESAAFGQSIEDASTGGLAGLNALLGTFNDILSVLNKVDDAIDSVTEDVIFDTIAGTFSLIAQGSRETVQGLERTLRMMQRVERQAQETQESTRQAVGEVRLRLPPRGGTTEPGAPLTPRLPPREEEPIERPDAPTGPEFMRSRIQARRTRMEVEAFQELIRTGDVKAYREELENIQGVVNDLVEIEVRRLSQMGVEADRLQGLIELYRPLSDQMEEAEAASLSLLEAANKLRKSVEDQRGPPGLPEGVDRMDLGGQEARVRRAMPALEEALKATEDRTRKVIEALDEGRISLEDLRETGREGLAALVEAQIRFQESTEETTEFLGLERDTLRDLARTASGVARLASEMGALGDETARALQAATQLAEAAAQIASGNIIAGVASGIEGLVNVASSVFGESREERQTREEAEALARALRDLREEASMLRKVFSQVSGENISGFRSIFGPMSAPDDISVALRSIAMQMDELGLSMMDLETLANAAGLEVDDLVKALRGQDANTERVRDEIEALSAAMKQMRLDRFLETFRGKMSLLQTELELFDVEDPIEELRRVMDVFQEFTDLPRAFQRLGKKFDLSTPEGRKLLEGQIQQMFRRIQQGTMPVGEFGELTPDQFQNLLERMEGLLDEAGQQQGGTSRDFQVSRQITEITASKMIGVLSTLSTQAVHRNQLLARMLQQMGGTVPRRIAPPRPAAVGGRGTTVHREGDRSRTINVHPGAIQIQSSGDRLTRQDGRRAAEGFWAVVDRKMGEREDDKRLRGGG